MQFVQTNKVILMATAYSPGLTVSSSTTHRVRRILPIAGKVRVDVGDEIHAEDVIAEAFMPGDVFPINLANVLSLPPADVVDCMLKKEGDSIALGEPIARTKGIFGMFKNEYKSKVEGTIETISPTTGQLIVRGAPVPVQVLAYLSGKVAEVISNEGCAVESDIAFIQGIFGIGGEAFGHIKLACTSHDQEVTPDLITPDMKGCIVVGGARMHDSAVEKARDVGAAALIAGGLDDQDLRDFLGYDLGVAITGSEKMGITVIITEGFGDIAMAERTFDLFRSHEGHYASVNGSTQIRAGVMRPEVLIPLKDQSAAFEVGHAGHASGSSQGGVLDVGKFVRIIRDPYFGLLGEVSALPTEPHTLDSGSKARVLEVDLQSGESVIVPRANVELIEG